jgi:hypothetical protein
MQARRGFVKPANYWQVYVYGIMQGAVARSFVHTPRSVVLLPRFVHTCSSIIAHGKCALASWILEIDLRLVNPLDKSQLDSTAQDPHALDTCHANTKDLAEVSHELCVITHACICYGNMTLYIIHKTPL